MKSGRDVLPHPELPIEMKYEFMLEKFDKVATENALQKDINKKQKKISDQKDQIKQIQYKNAFKSNELTRATKHKRVTTNEQDTSALKLKGVI